MSESSFPGVQFSATSKNIIAGATRAIITPAPSSFKCGSISTMYLTLENYLARSIFNSALFQFRWHLSLWSMSSLAT